MHDKKLPSPNQIFEIPTDGSLGLLALGAVGLKAWRKKRNEAKKRNEIEGQRAKENKFSSEPDDSTNQPINK